MAILTGAYDPQAEASQDFGAIPSGEYVARISDSDMKPTKKNDGHYLELTYEVIDGPCKGRKVWARLNLDSPNDTAKQIANREFAAIRKATGVTNPRDSVEMHNKPHVIRVEFIPAGTTQKNGYVTAKDTNEIKAWKRLDGASGNAPSGASPQASAAATPASPSSPPWARNQAA